MAAEQNYSALLEEAENRLRQLSPERIGVAIALLAYLQATEENKAIEELLSIPGFAASFREAQSHTQEQANLSSNNHKVDTVGDNSSHLVAEDSEVWQAYLAVEQKWEEVFRRLANS